MKKITILGEEWSIDFRDADKDAGLGDSLDGYCDSFVRLIVVANRRPQHDTQDFDAYQRLCLRHEIIHAFLHESGLSSSWEHPTPCGHDETTIDWFAVQFPKLLKAFQEADAM